MQRFCVLLVVVATVCLNTGLAQGQSSEAAYEISFWESVRNSTNPKELQLYLEKFPNGKFAALARTRLTALGDKAGPAAPVAPAPAVAPVSAVAQPAPRVSRFPQPGDSWTYRLTYRKRWGEPARNPSMQTYAVKVGAASESEIVDQLSIDGASPIDTKHVRGGYLVGQGVSLFSPYLPVFESGSPSFPLGRIQILDTACRGMYICEVKGRVVGAETVSVRAGKFAAIKVVVDHAWRPSAGASANQNQMAQMAGGRTLTIWYAPEVKRAVKFSSRPTVGEVPPVETNFDLELESYQLK